MCIQYFAFTGNQMYKLLCIIYVFQKIQIQLLDLFSLGLYVGDTVEEQNAKSDIRDGDYMTIKKL